MASLFSFMPPCEAWMRKLCDKCIKRDDHHQANHHVPSQPMTPKRSPSPARSSHRGALTASRETQDHPSDADDERNSGRSRSRANFHGSSRRAPNQCRSRNEHDGRQAPVNYTGLVERNPKHISHHQGVEEPIDQEIKYFNRVSSHRHPFRYPTWIRNVFLAITGETGYWAIDLHKLDSFDTNNLGHFFGLLAERVKHGQLVDEAKYDDTEVMMYCILIAGPLETTVDPLSDTLDLSELKLSFHSQTFREDDGRQYRGKYRGKKALRRIVSLINQSILMFRRNDDEKDQLIRELNVIKVYLLQVAYDKEKKEEAEGRPILSVRSGQPVSVSAECACDAKSECADICSDGSSSATEDGDLVLDDSRRNNNQHQVLPNDIDDSAGAEIRYFDKILSSHRCSFSPSWIQAVCQEIAWETRPQFVQLDNLQLSGIITLSIFFDKLVASLKHGELIDALNCTEDFEYKVLDAYANREGPLSGVDDTLSDILDLGVFEFYYPLEQVFGEEERGINDGMKALRRIATLVNQTVVVHDRYIRDELCKELQLIATNLDWIAVTVEQRAKQQTAEQQWAKQQRAGQQRAEQQMMELLSDFMVQVDGVREDLYAYAVEQRRRHHTRQ